jgi:phosphoglycerate dehydrogenase-like enzyme
VLDGTPDLRNKRVGVLGVGKVGGPLAELLAQADARLVIAGTDSAPAHAVHNVPAPMSWHRARCSRARSMS